MLQNLSGRLKLGGALSALRSPATGAKPNTTKFPITLIIGGVGCTFRAASLVTGDYNLAFYYTAQAQEEATFGHGVAGDEVNQGFIYFQLQTVAPAAIDGPVRFLLEGAHGDAIPGGLVLVEDSTRLDASASVRTQQVPLPEWAVWATEDSRLAIRINPTVTATSTAADSTVQVPACIRRKTV